MNPARSLAWRITCRVRVATYSPEISATMIRTRSAVASVNLVFRLSAMFFRGLVLFELVVQGLQADAKQLGRARLVLIRRGQRLQNQFALGSSDRRPWREAQAG